MQKNRSQDIIFMTDDAGQSSLGWRKPETADMLNGYSLKKTNLILSNPPPNSPCCCVVSCWPRVILADQGWRSLRWWRADQKKRWKWGLAAGTPFATQLPAAWGQHLETWEVCHLKGPLLCKGTHIKHCSSQSAPHKDRIWGWDDAACLCCVPGNPGGRTLQTPPACWDHWKTENLVSDSLHD